MMNSGQPMNPFDSDSDRTLDPELEQISRLLGHRSERLMARPGLTERIFNASVGGLATPAIAGRIDAAGSASASRSWRSSRSSGSSRSSRSWRSWRPLAAAAALLLVCGAMVTFYFRGSPPSEQVVFRMPGMTDASGAEAMLVSIYEPSYADQAGASAPAARGSRGDHRDLDMRMLPGRAPRFDDVDQEFKKIIAGAGPRGEG